MTCSHRFTALTTTGRAYTRLHYCNTITSAIIDANIVLVIYVIYLTCSSTANTFTSYKVLT